MEPLMVYILGSLLIALLVALFQYKPWSKNSKTYVWVLMVCRTITLASILILLCNLTLKLQTTTTEQPQLSVLLDNTASIRFLNKHSTLESLSDKLRQHKALNKTFDVRFYTFGDRLWSGDSLNFLKQQTNIGAGLESILELSKKTVAPVVLISDGNQTIGPSFTNLNTAYHQPIYPIILGDSTAYKDLKIKQINVNATTFLDHKFPIEIFVNYSGKDAAQTILEIYHGKTKVYTQSMQFSKTNTSQIVTANLEAKQAGFQRYTARVKSISGEKITSNNIKEFGIEVIDETIKIALISSISHPDLKVLKSFVESQKNFEFIRLTPSEFLENPETYGLFMLYQPNLQFNAIFEYLKQHPTNSFVICGTNTDFDFLNAVQEHFKKEVSNQPQEGQALINPNFEPFSTNEINFAEYPPLQSTLGDLVINSPNDILLYKVLAGYPTQIPMMFSYDSNFGRHLVLDAENIWRWRMYSYQENQSFESIDTFFITALKYLTATKSFDPLRITHDPIFDGSSPLQITAQLFNNNNEINTTAHLDIELTSKTLENPLIFPFQYENFKYKVDLSALEAALYSYTVRTKNNTYSKTGQFEILPFNIESQFLNANVTQLNQLANKSGGQAYFDFQFEALIENLLSNETYKPIQKIDKKTVPLIDFKIILFLLLISLSLEWFLRKYYGLI